MELTVYMLVRREYIMVKIEHLTKAYGNKLAVDGFVPGDKAG